MCMVPGIYGITRGTLQARYTWCTYLWHCRCTNGTTMYTVRNATWYYGCIYGTWDYSYECTWYMVLRMHVTHGTGSANGKQKSRRGGRDHAEKIGGRPFSLKRTPTYQTTNTYAHTHARTHNTTTQAQREIHKCLSKSQKILVSSNTARGAITTARKKKKQTPAFHGASTRPPPSN